MNFRDLAVELDAAVFEDLCDEAVIDGRPCLGKFDAPWLQPELGRLRTSIVEPRLVVRDADAAGVARGSLAAVLGDDYDVVSIEPDGSGVTALILRPRA
jgi:hypothetical protein